MLLELKFILQTCKGTFIFCRVHVNICVLVQCITSLHVMAAFHSSVSADLVSRLTVNYS